MTVSSSITTHSYIPAGSMLAESLAGLVFINASDLVVTDPDDVVQVLGTDYEITGNGRIGAGSIRALRAYGAGIELTITRISAIVQQANIESSQPLPAEAIEKELDRRALIEQERLRDQDVLADRAILAPKGESAGLLPPLLDGLGKFLARTLSGAWYYSTGTGGGDAALRSDLATDIGQDIVGTKQPEAGAKSRSGLEKFNEIKTITDYGNVVADGTVQNDNIIDALTTAFDATDRVTVIIPPGVRWNPQVVFADAGVKALERLMLFDLSGFNQSVSDGENSKFIGLFSVDMDATEDSQFGHVSNHHPTLFMSNTGEAGTESAQIGRATILVARGYYANGNKSFKGAFAQQYRRSFADNDVWEFATVSLAPWEALADGANYRQWEPLTAFAIGDYVATSLGAVLKCTDDGVSGAVEPAPAVLGTAVDGTVTWQWIDATERQVFAVDQKGRVHLNGANVPTDLFGAKQAITDTSVTAVVRFTGTGASKRVRLILEPTDVAGDIVAVPYIQAFEGALEFRDETNLLLAIMEGAGAGFKMVIEAQDWRILAAGDTTPTPDKRVLYTANVASTVITGLDAGVPQQVVTIIAGDTHTTLQNSADFMLQGSADILLTPYSSVHFLRVSNGLTTRWIETGRSIK